MKTLVDYWHYFKNSIYNRGWGFTFKLLFYELYTERKLGINTLLISDLNELNLNAEQKLNGNPYQGVSYFIFELTLKQLPQACLSGAFVDLGCGKGRALVLAALKGFRQVKGVEFSAELCDLARQNLHVVLPAAERQQVIVYNQDARLYDFKEEDGVIFLFNPFNEQILRPVLDNLQKSISYYKHDVYLIYVNPVHESLLGEAGGVCVYSLQSKRYKEAVIYHFKKNANLAVQ